jgi:hypothetical protein
LCLPIDLILGDCRVLPDRLSTDAFVVDQLERMQIDFQCVREFMQRQASTRAFRYDLRVKETSFQPGDLVWYFYPRRRTGLKDKWNKNYTGPYQVLDKLSPVLYRIRKSSKSPPLIVYVDKLKLVEGDFFPMENDVRAPVGFEPEDVLDDTSLLGQEIVRPKRMTQKPVRFRCDV